MRKVLFAILAVSAGVVLGADEICGAPRVQARAEIIWTKPLCKEPGRYIGWPTVCRAPNGDLLAVFSGDRDEHVCPFGKRTADRPGARPSTSATRSSTTATPASSRWTTARS